MDNNNKKVDIKSLLEQNNIKVNNNQQETDIKKIASNVPEGFDPTNAENAKAEMGQVFENNEILKHSGIRGGGVPGNIISAEQMAAIEDTIREIEEETELAKAEFEAFQKMKEEEEAKRKEEEMKESLAYEDDDSFAVDEPKNVVEESMDDGVERSEDFLKRYNEAVVIIDKTGMGQVINFTDEERAKMKKVKSIKLKEVETVELKSIKTKKAKTGIADRILQKRNTIRNTTIVLPISGLTMVMKGCSTFELMGLITGQEVNVMTLVAKWTLIHSKVESTSIGKMDFNTFLNNVASLEYDILVYGILCATFPDEDVFPLTCPMCRVQ